MAKQKAGGLLPRPLFKANNELLNLLNTGQCPATAAVSRLGHVPDFIKWFGRASFFFPDQAMETHADNVATSLFGDIENFSVELHNVGFLLRRAPFAHTQLDFSEHFRRGEFADVIEIAGIVGSLQANEVDLGVARKAFDIESSCCLQQWL